jgi:hypothetical protein
MKVNLLSFIGCGLLFLPLYKFITLTMSGCAFAQGVYRAGQVQGVNIQTGTRLSGKFCSVCVHYKYLLANYVSDGCNVVDLDPVRSETFSQIRNEFE